MVSTFTARTRIFSDDEQGSVGVLFGLMAIAMLFLAGIAVDYSRILNVKAKMTAAADAAVLAAGRALRDGIMTESQIEALAKTYFQENTKRVSKAGTIGIPAITVDRDRGAVSMDVNATVSMTLSRLGGIKSVNVPVTTEAVFENKDVEVGMALDITGSMNNKPAGSSERKIKSLKSAFEKFAMKLLPDNRGLGQRVRIGLAPYSAGINLGNFADAASNSRSGDGCVTDRDGGVQDDNSSATFLVAVDGRRDIDPVEGIPTQPAYYCPSAKIVPLTSDRQTLIDEVNSFNVDGWTAGHLGTQWAWNLVSENWADVWGGDARPDTYAKVGTGKLIKAIVLMTDGTFNTAYHSGSSSDQAIALCKAMKDKGVVVFSVAFDATAAARATLEACATDTDDYYADASNGAELEAAFEKFATILTELRIAK